MAALPALGDASPTRSSSTLLPPSSPLVSDVESEAHGTPGSPVSDAPRTPGSPAPPASPTVSDIFNHQTFEPDVILVAAAFLQANNVYDGRPVAEVRKSMRVFGRRAFVKRFMSLVRVPVGDYGRETYEKFLLFMMTSPDFTLQQQEYGQQVEAAVCFEVRNRIVDFI